MLPKQLVKEAASDAAREFGLSSADAADFVQMALHEHKELDRKLMHFIATRKAVA